MEQGHAQLVTENVAEYLDHDVLLISLGKFRISHRKPNEAAVCTSLSTDMVLSCPFISNPERSSYAIKYIAYGNGG